MTDWPQNWCGFCEEHHCDICGAQMGLVNHGQEVCVDRRNIEAAHHVNNQIQWGNLDAAKETLERAERQGWLKELEQKMVELCFIELIGGSR